MRSGGFASEAPSGDTTTADEGSDVAPHASGCVQYDMDGMPAFKGSVCPKSPIQDPLVNPLDGYVEALVKRLGEALDPLGLAGALLRSSHVVTTFKEGVAVFDLPWVALLRDASEKAFSSVDPALEELVSRDTFPAADNGASLNNARGNLVCGMTELAGVLRRCYSALGAAPLCSFDDVHERLLSISRRFVGDIGSSRGPFSTAQVPLSMEELKALLLQDVNRWGLSTFPYLVFAVSSRHPLQLVWNDATVDKAELAFHVYYMVARINRWEEETGSGRGILFPVEWMDELLRWLTDRDEVPLLPLRCPSQSLTPVSQMDYSPVPCAPGPFDISRVLRVTAEDPSKHMVQYDDGGVDVIPEDLFDYLWSLFGGGAKYIVMGKFRNKSKIMELLKPKRVSIAVTFEGSDREGQLRVDSLLLDDVLPRASLSEVSRRAIGELLDKHQYGWENGMELFGLTRPDNVIEMCVTHVHGKELQASRLVEVVDGKTVEDLLGDFRSSTEVVTDHCGPVLRVSLLVRHPAGLTSPAGPGFCGLTNVGNTCYMNSALQCLLSLGAVCRLLFSLRLSEYANLSITREFVNLLRDMLAGRRVAKTLPLKTAIGSVERRFNTYEQQDAVEFIEVLLDRIHEEMNHVYGKRYRERLDTDKDIPKSKLANCFWEDAKANNQSFVPQLFSHQSVHFFVCCNCKGTSTVFDNGSTLVATIAPPTRRVFDVDVLLPGELVRRVQVKVACGSDDRVRASDIEKEIWERLHSTNTDFFSSMATSVGCPEAQAPLKGKGQDNKQSLGDYRAVLCADSHTCFSDGGHVLHAAVLWRGAGLGAGEKRVLPTGPSLANRNSTEEFAEAQPMCNEFQQQREMKDQCVYIWYFLQPQGSSSPRDALLCHVECSSVDALGDRKSSLAYIIERSVNLGDHFLSWKLGCVDQCTSLEQDGGENKHLQRGPKKNLRVWFCSTMGDNGYYLNLEDTGDGRDWIDSGDLPLTLSMDSRVVIQYDDQMMQLSDAIRVTNFHSVGSSPFPGEPTFYSCNGTNKEAVDVHECLKSTFSSDILTGENSLNCSKCGGFCDGRVERRLFRLPPCLIISLKRFKLDIRGVTKDTAFVRFSEELDMKQFMDEESPEKHTKYKLVGVVFHRGGLSYGHYTAARFSKATKQWFCCDDSSVMVRDKGPWAWPAAGDAYILCYEQLVEG
ncbi:ubiquitin carboxyl-terminal hydrolase, putative [Trypanosoma brucei brucei TREU927]|uniref:Ubiquitin carboxyl-terminal hydrolase, putative n=1 Tax=Trypanosoma brucei brucei (strain 927/4 GUTat10.1) TaxID=185431 RepID=Q381H6_TRYB2|nr:ubiquitin carboxyl-terminal hydrolase, putative [Trypanosoma brucei brucei TREU927]EAN80555.1 ubiquitin carboxyl-terminal hydrolase, putative [Trypanosoma brucei brucei TREU927]